MYVGRYDYKMNTDRVLADESQQFLIGFYFTYINPDLDYSRE